MRKFKQGFGQLIRSRTDTGITDNFSKKRGKSALHALQIPYDMTAPADIENAHFCSVYL